MNEKRRSDLVLCLSLLLRPIARFCARHSLYIQDIIEAAKIAFLEVAREDLSHPRWPVSIIKLSTYTGIHRRDIARIVHHEEIKDTPQSLVSRVIGTWQQSKKYRTTSGKPRVLSIDGDNDEFASLVQSISTEMRPGSVLYELERLGAVKKTRRGLKLIRRAFVPKGDIKAAFNLLQKDIDDLICSVEGNVYGAEDEYNLHVKTHYDKVAPQYLPEIRDWLAREGSALHQKARNYLSQFDADINSEVDVSDEPARVALGSFSLISISSKKSERRADD